MERTDSMARWLRRRPTLPSRSCVLPVTSSDYNDAVDDAESAADLFRQAFNAQMNGELESAEGLYRRSIAAHPAAEAHTFLGWTFSFRGDLRAAIEECKKA